MAGEPILRPLSCDDRGRGLSVETLDGDAIRRGFPHTGFSRAERDAHVTRSGYLASRLEFYGVDLDEVTAQAAHELA